MIALDSMFKMAWAVIPLTRTESTLPVWDYWTRTSAAGPLIDSSEKIDDEIV